MNDNHILVVEDDEVLCRAINAGLSSLGLTVRIANTIADGMEMLSEHMPQVLVLDIDLPDGTGWDIVSHIRADGHSAAPSIVVTTSTRVPRAKLREYEISRYVPKPFDIGFLAETVRSLLPSQQDAESTSRSHDLNSI